MNFLENIGLDTSKFMETKNGMSYLSWAVAVSLAKTPQHAPVMFNHQPYRRLFRGAVVAIDMLEQRIWLPVLDERNNPIAAENVTSRDVSDALQRCRAKAVAMITGIGMSIYAGFDGNGGKFVAELGLTAESDLANVKAITSKKGGNSSAEYLDWASALSAVKATDEAFRWEVVEYPGVDFETGEVVDMPYLKTNDTAMVCVRVVYKGREHLEWLPIMGVLPVKTKHGEKKMDHQPLINPNVFDWNRSVMRCLTKAISVVSGYGLSIYAGEDLLTKDEAGGADSTPPDLTEVRELLKETGKTETAMCEWLGVQSLEDADREAITKAEDVLRKALEKAKAPPAPATPKQKQTADAWPA